MINMEEITYGRNPLHQGHANVHALRGNHSIKSLNFTKVTFLFSCDNFVDVVVLLFLYSTKINDWFTHFSATTELRAAQEQWSRSAARWPRILVDLERTHFLARFVVFHFTKFVYIQSRSYLSNLSYKTNCTKLSFKAVKAESQHPLPCLAAESAVIQSVSKNETDIYCDC